MALTATKIARNTFDAVQAITALGTTQRTTDVTLVTIPLATPVGMSKAMMFLVMVMAAAKAQATATDDRIPVATAIDERATIRRALATSLRAATAITQMRGFWWMLLRIMYLRISYR